LDLKLCINDTFSNYQPYNHVSQYTWSSTYCHMFLAAWLIITGFGLDLLTPSFTITLNHNQFTITYNMSSPQFWSEPWLTGMMTVSSSSLSPGFCLLLWLTWFRATVQITFDLWPTHLWFEWITNESILIWMAAYIV
jgi:hypothetical protein